MLYMESSLKVGVKSSETVRKIEAKEKDFVTVILKVETIVFLIISLY